MRKNKFQDQLVDGLMVLSSALKSGMSLNQAVEILVEEMPSPLNEEFALVMQENRMGVPLEECLQHLKQRMPLDDLGLITSAIGVARETGGDLTEIFSQLVFTIREKNKLERKVRTLTVQGRLQGVIMGILPVGFAFFISRVNPESFNVLLNTRVGQMLLVYAVASEIIGVILIKKLSRVEV
jgi:tight adherence protein B